MVETIDNLTEQLGKKGLIERLSISEMSLGGANFESVVQAAERRNYDALGAIYPILTKEQRTYALKSVLRQMDGITNIKVRLGHTPYIRDPQLLADIGASRPNYWPGTRDERSLWMGKTFDEVRGEVIDERGLFRVEKVRSDFLLAYAFLRSVTTTFGNEYLKVVDPDFLERILKGIVAIRFASSEDNSDVEKGRARLRELLPKSLHKRIDSVRKEADWVYIPEVVS